MLACLVLRECEEASRLAPKDVGCVHTHRGANGPFSKYAGLRSDRGPVEGAPFRARFGARCSSESTFANVKADRSASTKDDRNGTRLPVEKLNRDDVEHSTLNAASGHCVVIKVLICTSIICRPIAGGSRLRMSKSRR